MGKKNKKKIIPALDNSAVEQNAEVVIAETNENKVEKPVEKAKPEIKKTKKAKKEKKASRLGRMFKETGSELKKVSWPTFPKVVKQTGIVLAVVVCFGVVLFGFDYLLKFLFGLLVG